MKLCIPVCAPEGLASRVEPHLPRAEHLLLFDSQTREIRHVALREHLAGGEEAPHLDVVLCASLDGATRRALAERGIAAFGTEAGVAGEAIAEFERLNPPGARREEKADHGGHGGCGGCNGQGGREGCGCGGHGHHAHSEDAFSRKSRADALRIAVSSQNRKTITGHAGRCRRFWVYEIRGSEIGARTLRELKPEQTLHSSEPDEAHPLGDVHVMITSGMSPFLYQRLQRGGIRAFVTGETDPDEAVRTLLEKTARMP